MDYKDKFTLLYPFGTSKTKIYELYNNTKLKGTN